MADLLTRARGQLIVLAVATVVLALLPLVVTSQSARSIAVRALLFALLGVAWNVMGGFAGQFSFGHAAFFGIGAYTAAVLLVDLGLSPWIGMALGAVLGAAFGALTGFLSFRYQLKGAYFALATFAFAEMLRLFVLRYEPLNAARGYRVPLLGESSWWMLQFAPGSPNYYFVVLGLLAVTLAIVILLMHSRTGLFVLAVREDEAAAEAAGVDGTRAKVIAVAISAALTAVAGGFYLQFFFFIDPELVFGPRLSVQILLPAIIGGVGTVWGPAVGALILIPLGELSAALVRNPPAVLSVIAGRSGVDLIIFAVLLILIIMFLPKGVYGTIAQRAAR